MMRLRDTLARHGAVFAALLLLVTAVACSDDSVSATPFEGTFTGTPTAGAAVSQLPEETTISVSDGDFDSDEVRLLMGVPTMMFVTNEDDEDYYLRVEDLITETVLPAGETTEVGFTTPNSGEYEAELLDGPGGDEIATTLFVVREPGGGTP